MQKLKRLEINPQVKSFMAACMNKLSQSHVCRPVEATDEPRLLRREKRKIKGFKGRSSIVTRPLIKALGQFPSHMRSLRDASIWHCLAENPDAVHDRSQFDRAMNDVEATPA